MKKIICLFAFLFAGSVNAAVINDFTGGYDVGNWDQVLDGGSINLSGAPSSIIEMSSNIGNGSSATNFTIAALGDGMVSFDWDYTTADSDGPLFDPFGWLLNGAFTQVTANGGSDHQLGSVSFAVVMGDIFGFSATSVDSIFGAASTTISNFSAPMAVPEPPALLLLGLGLAGLGVARKKQKG